MNAAEIQAKLDTEDDIFLPPGEHLLERALRIWRSVRLRGSGYSTILRPLFSDTINRIHGTTLLICPEYNPLTIIPDVGDVWPFMPSGAAVFPMDDDTWMEIGKLDYPIKLEYKPELPEEYQDRRSLISGQLYLYYNAYNKQVMLKGLLSTKANSTLAPWTVHPEILLQDQFNKIEIGADYLKVNDNSIIAQHQINPGYAVLGYDLLNGIPGPGGQIKGLGMRFNETYGLVTPTTRTVDAVLRRFKYPGGSKVSHVTISDLQFMAGDTAIHASQSNNLLLERIICDHQSYLNIDMDNNCFWSIINMLRAIGLPDAKGGIRCNNNSGASILNSVLSANGVIVDFIGGAGLISNTTFDCNSKTRYGVRASGAGGVDILNIQNCSFSDESAVWGGSSVMEAFVYWEKMHACSINKCIMISCMNSHRPKWHDHRGNCMISINNLYTYEMNL